MRIIQDTRERTPWRFSSKYEVICSKLDVGDYSVEGLEHLLCIERKAAVTEFVNNMSEERFKKVLEKMEEYRYRFLIFEFDVDDVLRYPVGSEIPRKMWHNLKVKPQYIMRYISEIQVYREIPVIFAGDTDNARYIASNIMKRVYEKHLDNDTSHEE